MGVITVFLTVTFITFLGGIGQLGPITTLKSGVQLSGDFDVLFKGHSGGVPIVLSNPDYQTFVNDNFDAPYLSHNERIKEMAAQSLSTRIPTVNFTELENISKTVYKDRGLQEPLELFPRWIAQANLINSVTRKTTSAHMVAGD